MESTMQKALEIAHRIDIGFQTYIQKIQALELKVELLGQSVNQQSILVDTLMKIMEELKKPEPSNGTQSENTRSLGVDL